MRRPTKVIAVAGAVLISSSLAGGATTGSAAQAPWPQNERPHTRPAMQHIRDITPAPGRLLRVPDMPGRQHLWCRGQVRHVGDPTIVVVSGAGDYSLSWRAVQGRLRGQHRVCTFDRAGLGWSSASPTPRTARIIVPQMARLLRAGGVTGPLILAAHSMGAIYARVFAARHLARIQGVVLVDPGDERLDVDIRRASRRALRAGVAAAAAQQTRSARTCATGTYARDLNLLPLPGVFPAHDARVDRRLLAGWCRIWRTNAAEGRGAAATWSQARKWHLGPGSLGSIPLGIIVSSQTLTFVAEPALNRNIVHTWRRLQHRQVALSSRHRFAVAPDSSHAVMLDRPGRVAAMIRWVADQR